MRCFSFRLAGRPLPDAINIMIMVYRQISCARFHNAHQLECGIILYFADHPGAAASGSSFLPDGDQLEGHLFLRKIGLEVF